MCKMWGRGPIRAETRKSMDMKEPNASVTFKSGSVPQRRWTHELDPRRCARLLELKCNYATSGRGWMRLYAYARDVHKRARGRDLRQISQLDMIIIKCSAFALHDVQYRKQRIIILDRDIMTAAANAALLSPFLSVCEMRVLFCSAAGS